jgi:hypothetical protein
MGVSSSIVNKLLVLSSLFYAPIRGSGSGRGVFSQQSYKHLKLCDNLSCMHQYQVGPGSVDGGSKGSLYPINRNREAYFQV